MHRLRLILPLHVLVYEDAAGKVWVAYEDVGVRADDLEGLSSDDPVLAPLKGALDKLSGAAAGQ